MLHLADHGEGNRFTLQVDFLGNGRWYDYLALEVEAGGYRPHVFPDGYSAHWVRVVPERDGRATAQFFYR